MVWDGKGGREERERGVSGIEGGECGFVACEIVIGRGWI